MRLWSRTEGRRTSEGSVCVCVTEQRNPKNTGREKTLKTRARENTGQEKP